jgi:hypothetical protein
MEKILTVKVPLSGGVQALRTHAPLSGAIDDVHARLARLAALDPSEHPVADAISNAEECTVVYHACGSCYRDDGSRGYLIEYFCTSGGSQPDHTECEAC